jgi:pimeloyl-ACP methyl ester carboxylesterase
LLGHGRTPLPDSSSSDQEVEFSSMSDAVAEVLDQLLRDGEKAVVVGNSMGGMVALKCAVDHGRLVRGLFLLSPAGAPVDEAELKAISEMFKIGSLREGRRFIRRMHGWRGRRRIGGVLATLMGRAAKYRVEREAVRTIFARALEGGNSFLTPADAERVDVECCLFWGKEEKVLEGAKHVQFFRDNLKRLEVLEEEGFGHVRAARAKRAQEKDALTHLLPPHLSFR